MKIMFYLLFLLSMNSCARNDFPIVTIYSELEGAQVYKAVGFEQKFVEIGVIKNGEISFENTQGRYSVFKLVKLSEDGMWRYEAIVDAESTPRGSHNEYSPDTYRYATKKNSDSISNHRQISENEIIKKKRENFERINKDIIYDKKNKLIWQDSLENKEHSMPEYYGAKQDCHDLVLSGFSFWRLPTYKELLDAVDYSSKTYMVPVFKDVKTSSYWTSMKTKYDGTMVVDMKTGTSYFSSFRNYYRCVKNVNSREEIK